MSDDRLAPLAPLSKPGPRLYRVPTDHVDSMTVSEDNHHPSETPAPSRRPSSTVVASQISNGTQPGASADPEKGLQKPAPTPAFEGGGGLLKSLTRSRVQGEPAPDPRTRAWKNNIVTFDSKTDPANPKNWTMRHRYMITMIYGMNTLCATFASSVFSSASKYVGAEFGVGTEVMVLGVSLFVLGYVFGPLLWGAVSEIYGRKLSVFPAMVFFVAFSAGTATAKDLQTIFITRFFAGLFASAPVTTVGGALADLFEQRERGTAVVFYSLAVVAGPTLGPIIGGAVSQSYLGWRWTEYLVVILTSVVAVLGIVIIPETYAPIILTRKAKKLRLETGRWELHSAHEMQQRTPHDFLTKNLVLPIKMIIFEPMVTCIVLFNSFAYGILYLLFGAVPIFFEEERGWNTLVGALPFLAVLLGCLIAALINGLYSHLVFAKKVDQAGGHVRPELRLLTMMVGSVTFAPGFFLIGWTSNKDIFWFPELVGLVLVGMSFLLIFQSGMNYLIDSYTKRSASAVAANTFLRSIFACGLPFAASPLFNNIGIDWGCTLLGFVALVLGGMPFIFYVYGPRLRARSKLIEDL